VTVPSERPSEDEHLQLAGGEAAGFRRAHLSYQPLGHAHNRAVPFGFGRDPGRFPDRSMNLEQKIVGLVKKGVSKSETARRFGVHGAAVKLLWSPVDTISSLTPD
jgi:hypothetical protein